MPACENIPKSPNLRRRESAKVDEDKTSDASCKVEYTEEQIEAVQSIRRCKDYYEILGVSKDAGESELRRQYKKLALQFHPDKNKTPGAVEAFKAIGNSFAVLNDPVKRKQYDTYGLESAQRVHSENSEYYHTFEGDITPEDLFNMFFGGSGVGPTYVRRGTQFYRYTRTTNIHQEDNRSVFLQILPLLVLISLSLMSSFFVADPPYSLARTSKYLYERRTHRYEVPYYVKDGFEEEHKERIPYIEQQVEEEYVINIRTSCFRERNYKEGMIWRAKSFRDVGLEAKAQSLRTPSCDALNEIYRNKHKWD